MLGPTQLSSLLCFCSQDRWHVVRSIFFGFRWNVVCISGHYSGKENMANGFFDLKTNCQPIILPTTPTKHHRQYDKPIHDIEKPKKNLKTWNQLETKNLIKIRSIFLGNFKIKKTFNMSSPHQKKQFNTNFNYIGCQNRWQWILSLSSAGFQQLTLTSLTLGVKK